MFKDEYQQPIFASFDIEKKISKGLKVNFTASTAGYKIIWKCLTVNFNSQQLSATMLLKMLKDECQ